VFPGLGYHQPRVENELQNMIAGRHANRPKHAICPVNRDRSAAIEFRLPARKIKVVDDQPSRAGCMHRESRSRGLPTGGMCRNTTGTGRGKVTFGAIVLVVASGKPGRVVEVGRRKRRCVHALAGCGPWSNTGTTTVDYPPGAPSLSGGGTTNTGSYSVSWGGVANATSYNLQENANGAGWTTVQSSSATSWSTSGRGNGSYVYQVQACDAGGCSGWSNQVTETVALPPTMTNGPYMDSSPMQASRTLVSASTAHVYPASNNRTALRCWAMMG
jgi:hypothetical protein